MLNSEYHLCNTPGFDTNCVYFVKSICNIDDCEDCKGAWNRHMCTGDDCFASTMGLAVFNYRWHKDRMIGNVFRAATGGWGTQQHNKLKTHLSGIHFSMHTSKKLVLFLIFSQKIGWECIYKVCKLSSLNSVFCVLVRFSAPVTHSHTKMF